MSRAVSNRRVVLALAGMLALLLAATSMACGGAAEAREPDSPSSSEARPYDAGPLTINVSITDKGFEPPLTFVPAGRQIQFVLRNHTSREHHYHVLGLEVDEMYWLASHHDHGESALAGEEYDHDHGRMREFVDHHICTSASGICPTGEWLHLHAVPNDLDVIIFSTSAPGRFRVTDPLNPHLEAQMVVY